MAINQPTRRAKSKEVTSATRKQKLTPNNISNGVQNLSRKVRNALLVLGAAGAVDAAASTMLTGCIAESSEMTNEKVGQTSEALNSAIKYNAPTAPPWNDALTGSLYPVRNGNSIKLYTDSARSGGPGLVNIWVVGSNDNGVTWTSPSLQPVGYSGSGTAINVANGRSGAPVIFNGNTQIFYSKTGQIQLCDWNDSLNQGGNCNTIGSNVNVGSGHIESANAVDSNFLYYTDQVSGVNKILSTVIGTFPAGTVVNSLNTPTNQGNVFFNGNYGVVTSEGAYLSHNVGGVFNIFGFDWDSATQTASNITNLNDIAGSYQFNVGQALAPATLDSSGDLWYVDANGNVQWATKIASSPDAGTDAQADAGQDAPPDANDGGSMQDAGNDAQADAGNDAADSGMPGQDAGQDAMTMPDASDPDAGDSGTPMEAGTPDAGNPDGAKNDAGASCAIQVLDPMNSKICNVTCNTTGQDTVSLQDGNCQLKYTDTNGYVLLSVSSADFVSGQTVTMGINGGEVGTDRGFSIDDIADYGTFLIFDSAGFDAAPLGTDWRWQWMDNHTIKASVVDGTVLFTINGLPVQIPQANITDGKISGTENPSDPNKWNHPDSDAYVLYDINQKNIVGSSFANPSNLPSNVPPKGGCSCESVVGDTNGDLSNLFIAAGLVGIIAARKRKGYIGIESNQDKA